LKIGIKNLLSPGITLRLPDHYVCGWIRSVAKVRS
jgi:hypothetical protein